MTDLHDLDDPNADVNPSPFGQRGFILSAIFIALVVIAGVALTIMNLTDDDATPSPDDPPAQTPSATPTSNDPEASVCGLTSVKLNGGIVAPPTDVEWSLTGKTALPASKEHGPGSVEGRSRSCFAHTPEGALLAAASTYGWQTVGDLRAALKRSAVPGEGRDTALRDLAALNDDSADLTQGAILQVRGFRLITYRDKSALVDIASQATTVDGSSGLVRQQFELLWEQGDWLLRLAPDGSVPRAESIADLTGYVPWAGA